MNLQQIKDAFFWATLKPLGFNWVKHRLYYGEKASWCEGTHIYLRYKGHFIHELAHAFENALGSEKAESFFGFNYEEECIKAFGEFSGYHEEDWAELAEPYVERWVAEITNKEVSDG